MDINEIIFTKESLVDMYIVYVIVYVNEMYSIIVFDLQYTSQ